MQDSYQASMKSSLIGRLGRWGLACLAGRLRRWDRRTAEAVDMFLANSHTVAQRISDIYHRSAEVVYPPVDTDFFSPETTIKREGFYLVVGAMAPYKRIDHAVEAFASLPSLELVVIGTGQMEKTLHAKATSNVRFLGWSSNETIRDHYRRCKALLFPGEEDFGIIPVEAMACGAPVIAYNAGGATETVPSDPGMGLRYAPQSVAALMEAIQANEAAEPPASAALAVHAQAFSRVVFDTQYRHVLESQGVSVACQEGSPPDAQISQRFSL